MGGVEAFQFLRGFYVDEGGEIIGRGSRLSIPSGILQASNRAIKASYSIELSIPSGILLFLTF